MYIPLAQSRVIRRDRQQPHRRGGTALERPTRIFHIYVRLLSGWRWYLCLRRSYLRLLPRLLPYRSRRGCFSCTLSRCRALCVSSLPPSGWGILDADPVHHGPYLVGRCLHLSCQSPFPSLNQSLIFVVCAAVQVLITLWELFRFSPDTDVVLSVSSTELGGISHANFGAL